MKRFRLISIFCLTLLAVISCSRDKSFIGNDSGNTPKVISIPADQLVEYHYSYEQEVKNYRLNDIIQVGQYRGNRSISLLRFAVSGFPQAGFQLSSEGKLQFSVKNQHLFNNESLTLRLGLIKENWNETVATWDIAQAETDWTGSWDNLEPIEMLDITTEFVAGDSLIVFNFPKPDLKEIIEGFTAEEPTFFGFALFSEIEDEHFIELHSLEISDGHPLLSFDYLAAEQDTAVVSYQRKPQHNTFINSAKPRADYFIGEELKLANIVPTRSFLKLNYPIDLFNLPDNQAIEQITINRAELVLFIKEGDEKKLISDRFFQLVPYHPEKEYSLNDKEKLPIPEEELSLLIPYSVSTVTDVSDSLRVNVTSIVQAHLTKIRDNNGLVLASYSENKNNSHLSFHGSDATDEAKRPYLRIIYSLPYTP